MGIELGWPNCGSTRGTYAEGMQFASKPSPMLDFFFHWDISVIFCWDILVTETLQSFISQLYQNSPCQCLLPHFLIDGHFLINNCHITHIFLSTTVMLSRWDCQYCAVHYHMGATRWETWGKRHPTFSDSGDIIRHVTPYFLFRLHTILVSHQPVPSHFTTNCAHAILHTVLINFPSQW